MFSDGEGNKTRLDELMRKYKVQPVGKGYIDCIVTLDNVFGFIDELSDMNISIGGVTWWCHCQEGSSGCPHGMGGPKSEYFDGWFSEMPFPVYRFTENRQAAAYIRDPEDEDVLKCCVPALWLDVPREWENIFRRRRKG